MNNFTGHRWGAGETGRKLASRAGAAKSRLGQGGRPSAEQK